MLTVTVGDPCTFTGLDRERPTWGHFLARPGREPRWSNVWALQPKGEATVICGEDAERVPAGSWIVVGGAWTDAWVMTDEDFRRDFRPYYKRDRALWDAAAEEASG
jgi:hypothetical protein